MLALRSAPLRSGDYFVQFYGVYRDSTKLIVANGVSKRLMEETNRLARAAGANPEGTDGWRASIQLPCDAGTEYFRAVFDERARMTDSVAFGRRM